MIYLVGDVPFFERPDCDFLIVQDIYLPPFKVDAFLPATSFAEAGGTLVNIEGRVQEIVRVEDLPEGAVTGFMRPDWRIFADLARALESPAMNYETYQDVTREIHTAVPGFPAGPDRKPRRMTAIEGPAVEKPAGADEAETGIFCSWPSRPASGTGESTFPRRSAAWPNWRSRRDSGCTRRTSIRSA